MSHKQHIPALWVHLNWATVSHILQNRMVRQHWCEPLPMAIIRWWSFFWELGPNLTYRIRWEQSRNCLTSGVYPLHLFSFTYFVLNLVHTVNCVPYCYCWALYKTYSNTMLVSVVIIPLSLLLPFWAGNDVWLQYMYVFFNFIQYLILCLLWSLSRYTSSYLHSVSILKLNWWTFYASYQFFYKCTGEVFSTLLC